MISNPLDIQKYDTSPEVLNLKQLADSHNGGKLDIDKLFHG